MATTRTREVRTWRGVIRGQLHSVKRRCESLLAFNQRNPERDFLVGQEITDVQNVITLCTTKLADTHVR
jgi:hypothetical protein